jgi:hypothetical protein
MLKPVVAIGDGPGAPTVDPVGEARRRGVGEGELVLGWFVEPPEWLAAPPAWPARTYMPAYGLGRAARDGAVEYLPARLGAMPALLSGRFRAALAVVPGVRRGTGWAHLENVGLNDTMATSAQHVVVQEVEDADDVGAPLVEGDVVGVIGGGRRGPARVPRPIAPAEARIAELASALVPDGATLQYGIGAAPEAVVGAISRPVTILSGLVTDVVRELHDRGDVAGAIVGSYVWGGDALVDLVRRDRIRPVGVRDLFGEYQPSTVDRFVSINSALQVGLDGSVNIERVGGRQIAGLGGQPDWCAAATSAPDGMSIVVVTSTSRGVSTIVPTPEVVSTPRGDVGIVVTEHGIADLRGRTEAERRRALIAIAHPEHRERLARASG